MGSQVVDALRHVATDEQVHRLAAHIGDYGNQAGISSLADIQELRSAILHFTYLWCRLPLSLGPHACVLQLQRKGIVTTNRHTAHIPLCSICLHVAA